MKNFLYLILIFLFTTCEDAAHIGADATSFQQLIPDTTKNFLAAEHYLSHYVQTRLVQHQLHLENIENGTSAPEVRIWVLTGSFDPQVLFQLRKTDSMVWKLRVVQYQALQNNCVQADYSVMLSDSVVNAFQLHQYWSIPSQSEMQDGFQYGCMDGFVTLLEMADARKYKYATHTCPDIHAANDSNFYKINLLLDQFDRSSIQH